LGKAAQLLNIPIYALIELLKEKKIDYISLSGSQIEQEAETAKGYLYF